MAGARSSGARYSPHPHSHRAWPRALQRLPRMGIADKTVLGARTAAEQLRLLRRFLFLQALGLHSSYSPRRFWLLQLEKSKRRSETSVLPHCPTRFLHPTAKEFLKGTDCPTWRMLFLQLSSQGSSQLLPMLHEFYDVSEKRNKHP